MIKILKYLTILVFLCFTFEASAQDASNPKAGSIVKLCSSKTSLMSTAFAVISSVDVIGDFIGPPRMVLGPVIKPYGMSGNIVRCVQTVVNFQGAKLIASYVWFFGPLVMYAAMIAMLFHFMKTMFGVSRSQGIHFTFMAKLLLLIMFSNMWTVPDLLKWRNALLDFPMRFSDKIFIAMDSKFHTFEKTVNPLDPLNTSVQFDDVFDKLDRYTLKMLGMEKYVLEAHLRAKNDPTYTKEKANESTFIGIAALIAGLFFTGDVGFLLTMSTLGFVVVILVAMAQAALFYCTIVIAINFLIAVSPITMTCIIFGPTKNLAKSWFQYLIVYVTQPIMLMAYLALTFAVLKDLANTSPEVILSPISNCHPDKNIRNAAHGTPAECDINQYTAEAAKEKWQNETKEVSLGPDCDKISVSGKYLNASSFSPTAVSVANTYIGNSNQNAYTDGLNPSEGLGEYATEALKNACKLFAHSISLDSGNALIDRPQIYTGTSSFDADYLSEEHINQELLASKMAALLLFSILISMLKHLPHMISHMVGLGFIAPLANYSTKATEGARGAILGNEKGQGGAFGSLRGLGSSVFKKG